MYTCVTFEISDSGNPYMVLYIVPTNYYNVVAITSTGARYTLNKLPQGAPNHL